MTQYLQSLLEAEVAAVAVTAAAEVVGRLRKDSKKTAVFTVKDSIKTESLTESLQRLLLVHYTAVCSAFTIRHCSS